MQGNTSEAETIIKNINNFKKLHSGVWSDIYSGIWNGEQCALKFECNSARFPRLKYQAKVAQFFNKNIEKSKQLGLPQVKKYYETPEKNILCMKGLGLSLEDLLQQNKMHFSLKTVLMIAIQVIDILKLIHSNKFLHRDIKPAHLVMGKGKESYLVHLVDFGYAKRFIDKDGKLLPYRDNRRFTVISLYQSLNTLQGIEWSMRDDLESLGYVMIQCLNGTLPWKICTFTNAKDLAKKRFERKQKISIEELCKDLPEEILYYFQYVKGLNYGEVPDYDQLKKVLKNLFVRKNYTWDYKYDWVDTKK